MALKRPHWASGQLITLRHTSKVLADNPLGDPFERQLTVWLPAEYHTRKRKRFPVLFDLVGYSGSGPSHTNWNSFAENVPERLDRLMGEGRMGACIVVFPDCFTALGGNQYINSSAIGRYADYLTRELVPKVDNEFRTLASRDHRGCFGKSSGGYGAFVHGMRHADVWGAIANHSGDAYFDFVYRSDWPNTLNELAKHRRSPRQAGRQNAAVKNSKLKPGIDDGRVRRFLEHIWKTEKLKSSELMALMNLAMAASYDPDPKAPNGFRLPFDLESGELIERRWARWLLHDPIHMVSQHTKALSSLKGIYIDCGWRDQFHIHYGTRQLSKQLSHHHINHHYEEFDDTHSGIDYRMDVSLPFLYRRLR
ncbi:MAG: alpha/beta hydrolase-fold protein [Pseudomonadales bacterium]|nr:alpha/beta hydrolase-fold protein [Pseudomonadales bacterium]MDP6469906.1 alpha/beta hydrolase-fold protein [Pseudomonadales bacterium]MDP6970769.1 alpha/beta hydrolase-fold protein [Pseudomonadales bacterium]